MLKEVISKFVFVNTFSYYIVRGMQKGERGPT
jgi:hypothetical protein